MKVAVFGGTGGVGSHFVDQALLAGHKVTALVRNPVKLDKRKNLSVIAGDTTNPDDIKKAIMGADVVVSCLGNVKGVKIMEKAADAILGAAAEEKNPPKSVFISTIGCGGTSWVVKQMLQLIGGRESFADYERADARIAQEKAVPYVLVRPTALKEKPGNGKYRTFTGDGTFVRPIAKEDVAKFLLDAVSTDEWDSNGGVQLAGLK